MVAATGTLPSQSDGSRSISFASFNIRSGCNGGLEGALRAMDQLGVDIGFLLETKLTGGIYTCYSSGSSVLASTATLVWQGGIALFWRGNNLYEVKETQIWGANVISLQLRINNARFFVVRCYIPPSDLETLTDVKRAWQACPTGAHPLLVGNLNFNFHAPRTDHEEAIAEQVEAMGLVDMYRHFYQCTGKRLRGTWTWRMRREGRWISSQCNYFFGRETDRQRFRRISVRMPCHYSDHHALVAVIHAGGGEELKQYRQRTQLFPISLPHGP
jgi:hypothetical protein